MAVFYQSLVVEQDFFSEDGLLDLERNIHIKPWFREQKICGFVFNTPVLRQKDESSDNEC